MILAVMGAIFAIAYGSYRQFLQFYHYYKITNFKFRITNFTNKKNDNLHTMLHLTSHPQFNIWLIWLISYIISSLKLPLSILLSFNSNDGPCLVPALYTKVADFCWLSRKHRPRKRRPQASDLENANANLENVDLENITFTSQVNGNLD